MKKAILLSMMINVFCYSSAFCMEEDSSNSLISTSSDTEGEEEKSFQYNNNNRYDYDDIIQDEVSNDEYLKNLMKELKSENDELSLKVSEYIYRFIRSDDNMREKSWPQSGNDVKQKIERFKKIFTAICKMYGLDADQYTQQLPQVDQENPLSNFFKRDFIKRVNQAMLTLLQDKFGNVIPEQSEQNNEGETYFSFDAFKEISKYITNILKNCKSKTKSKIKNETKNEIENKIEKETKNEIENIENMLNMLDSDYKNNKKLDQRDMLKTYLDTLHDAVRLQCKLESCGNNIHTEKSYLQTSSDRFSFESSVKERAPMSIESKEGMSINGKPKSNPVARKIGNNDGSSSINTKANLIKAKKNSNNIKNRQKTPMKKNNQKK